MTARAPALELVRRALNLRFILRDTERNDEGSTEPLATVTDAFIRRCLYWLMPFPRSIIEMPMGAMLITSPAKRFRGNGVYIVRWRGKPSPHQSCRGRLQA